MSGDYSSFNRVVTYRSALTSQGEEYILVGNSTSPLSVPDSNDWNFTGPFCLEIFGVKFNAQTGINGLFGHYSTTSNQRSLALDYEGTTTDTLRAILSLDGGASVWQLAADFLPTVDQPYDICLERDGSNVVRMYIDGVMVASDTLSGTLFNSNQAFFVGQSSTTSNVLNGRFKAARVTRAARYASDGGYTVPTLPLPVHG